MTILVRSAGVPIPALNVTLLVTSAVPSFLKASSTLSTPVTTLLTASVAAFVAPLTVSLAMPEPVFSTSLIKSRFSILLGIVEWGKTLPKSIVYVPATSDHGATLAVRNVVRVLASSRILEMLVKLSASCSNTEFTYAEHQLVWLTFIIRSASVMIRNEDKVIIFSLVDKAPLLQSLV